MPITVTKPVPAHARVTVNLEGEDPAPSNAAVSTQVVSTQPLLVERSQYWPDPAPNTGGPALPRQRGRCLTLVDGAHDDSGVVAAEGE